jgi:hypothetical protein
MSETTVALPQHFAFLEPFAAQWGDLETQRERYLLRQNSKMEELRRFHAAAANRLGEIFDYLDGFPPGDLPPPEARLYRTVLGLAEVMQAVEVFGEPRVKNAPFPHDIDVTWTDVSKPDRNA